jgi:hypothetical protein
LSFGAIEFRLISSPQLDRQCLKTEILRCPHAVVPGVDHQSTLNDVCT